MVRLPFENILFLFCHFLIFSWRKIDNIFLLLKGNYLLRFIFTLNTLYTLLWVVFPDCDLFATEIGSSGNNDFFYFRFGNWLHFCWLLLFYYLFSSHRNLKNVLRKINKLFVWINIFCGGVDSFKTTNVLHFIFQFFINYLLLLL